MLVDSHCHLDFDVFTEDFQQILARAEEAGVKALQTICTRVSEFDKIHALTTRAPNIFCSVGTHPLNVEEDGIAKADAIIELTKRPKVIGIGETGLDYHYQSDTIDIQQRSFREHITAAQATQLPIIVHTRDADEDTITIMREMHSQSPFSGVIHCFTATLELAQAALDLGFYISASGIVTFKNATEIQDIFRIVPLNRILIETDAPYLAPVPKRGMRNEPSFVRHTAAFMAELKQVSFEQLCVASTENFFNLFQRAKV
jgi:TatD DNase family protein